MNDRMNKKIRTEKVNHQTADPKANASVFLFFPTAHFFKTILASSTNGTFAKPHKPTHSPSFAKEPFFAKPKRRIINYSNIVMSKTFKQIKTIPLLTFVVLFFNFFTTNAQTTTFYGTSKVQSDGYTGALYEVKIDRSKGFTYVKIQQVPTRNLKRMNSVTPSFNAKIKSGSYEAEYLGVLQNDGTIRRSSCSDNWGWDNVKTGESSYFTTYVFRGAIPPGLTNFSLEDAGSYSGCSGYKFSNYTLNNPDNHPKTGLSEYTLKQKVDEQNDGIVGIYEPFDKSGYKLGCIKDGGTYKLVYLSYGGTYMSWWKVGDVKATLRPSATTGVFKGDWYMSDKSINSDAYILFDGNTLKTVVAGEESGYLKMYPTGSGSISSGSQKSSGTGFAISSNGYIVTNYHVIENAKSIEVKGINGNFTRKLSAKIVVSDEKNDLAIIKIDDSRFTSLGTIPYIFRNGIADVGESIFVLGYPLTTTMGEEVKLTNGIISSRTGFKGDISLYQISAPVQPGNSGGPLFDKNGNLLGVINAKHSYAENAGYAIKVSYLISLMDLLPVTINQPPINSLNGKSLTEQVKVASNFTYLIIINDKDNQTSSSSSSSSSSNSSSPSISSSSSTQNSTSNSDQQAATYYKKAVELWEKQDFKGALEQITLSIEASPNYAGSYYFRAFVYLYGIRNFENAISDFTKSIRMEPDFEGAYFYRGMAYQNLEKNIEAIKDFSKVISLNKENTDAYFMRALVKSNLNDRQGAITDYDEIIKREKTAKPSIYKISTVYNNKAYCLVELGKPSDALPFVTRALELDKSEAYIWDTRGEAYFKLGEYEKCIKDMDKAISIEESDNSYYIRGLAKIKIGKTIDGCKDLSKAGELGKLEAYNEMQKYCK